MNDSFYAGKFVDFVQQYFGDQSHVFVVFSKTGKTKYLSGSGVSILNPLDIRQYFRARSLLLSSERIFLHSLFDTRALLFLLLNHKLLKKTSWVIWGGDLYNYWIQDKHSFRDKVREVLRRKIIVNVDKIISLVKEDYDFARMKYDTNAGYCFGFYPNPVDFSLLDSILAKRRHREADITNSELRILVGNSASWTNNHLEALRILSGMKINLPFKIFCPLSYGDSGYAAQVIEFGKNLFNDAFVPMTEFMPPEKYAEFLADVDIALFAHRRQQALGNILALLYLGKKVYIRSDISTWGFLKRHGIKVFDYKELASVSFDEFIYYDKQIMESNRRKIKENFSEQQCVVAWKRIFDSACGQD